MVLSGDEHHHFARALRFQVGDALFVTNGRGLILECRANAVGRSSTNADVLSVAENAKPARQFVLALGAIRKQKFEQAFEQCVELGITRCIPFTSENAHDEKYNARFLDRLHKISVGAMKQSFRSWLPRVTEPVAFDQLVKVARLSPHTVVGRQGGDLPVAPPADGDVLVVVGPEAGLAEAEFGALEEVGAVFATVTPRRLRAETAAVALVAVLGGGD